MNIVEGEKYFINIDFDNTLYFDNAISANNIHTLKSMQKKGHKLILNTGRSKGNLPKAAFKIKWDYLLCGASYIEDAEGNVLFHEFLDKKQILTAFRFASSVGTSFSLEGEKRNVDYKKEDIENKKNHELDEIIAEFYEENKDNPITKVSFWKPLDKRIESKLPGFKTIIHHDYAESFLSSSDKGTLIDKFMEIVSTDPLHMIGIGDSLNDMEMFDRCEAGRIAMKLACDELKQRADYVTKRSTSGVGEGIFALLVTMPKKVVK